MAMSAGKPIASKLIIDSPDAASIRVQLENRRYRLGRSSANELPFPADPNLSREHLLFEPTFAGWTVQDLGSRNGSKHNGIPLTAVVELTPGDRISAGHLSIRYEVPADETHSGPTHQKDIDLTGITFVSQNLAGAAPAVSLDLQSALEASPAATGQPALTESHMRALMRAGRELAGLGVLDKLFELVLDLSFEFVNASRGVIMTVDKTGELRIRAARGESFRISTEVRDLVMKQAKSLLVRGALLEQDFASRPSIFADEIRSIMAVPLQTDEHVMGLIYLDSPHQIREFTTEDLNLITVIANIAAIRIEHSRLLEREQARKLLDQDLERSSEIQRGLLPSKVPEISGFDCAGYSMPCRTVGGDYYDFIPYTDGRVAMLIGDVSGKGLGAALLMASLQARAQAIFEEPENVAAEVDRLNRSIAANCPGNSFITFFIAVLDPGSDEIIYCNAGHDPPLLLRSNREVELLEATGMPLGISRNAHYEQKRCRLSEGDQIVLFSDGITEACGPGSDDEFGEERLIAALKKGQQRSATEVIEDINAGLRLFACGPPADDMTLVVAKARDESSRAM